MNWYSHSDTTDDLVSLTPSAGDTGAVSTNTTATGALAPAADAFYYHTDHQGSVRAITDEAGNIVNEYAYDSYGNAEVAVETVLQRFRYTARFFDVDTGLYYYRARHYDAGTGRFNQEDPIWFAAGDLNVHRYVWNNPVNWNDPSGLAATAENRVLAAITAGTIAGLRAGVINVARLTASYANRLGLNATGARHFQKTVRHNLDELAAGTGTLGDLIAVNLGGIAAVLLQVNSDAPDDSNNPPIDAPGDWPDGSNPPPGDGWEWRGKDPNNPGGRDGGWTRPAPGTPKGKESLHDDRGHPGGKRPHIGWVDGNGNHWENYGGGWVPKGN